ncbi:hypothetical protein ACOSQ3_025567 [Xanthoceras sorbifolium]
MMDDDTTTSARPKTTTKRNIYNNNNKRLKANTVTEKSNENDAADEECGDAEVWDSLSRSFRQVQTVLDKNRELIRRANENHQSRIPDNIASNVSLIREINSNISKVVSVYSDLSVNFTSMVSQRRRRTSTATNSSGRVDVESSES